MKNITICADDFGMHDAVSTAIIKLIENNVVHATSCLVNFPNWFRYLNNIINIKRLHIGLHLNFTEGLGLSDKFKTGFSNISLQLLKTHLRLYKTKSIEIEIQQQLDTFIKHVGRIPDYIDGHNHVHHLPVIQDALFNVLTKNSIEDIWIRSITPNKSPIFSIKNTIINISQAMYFARKLRHTDKWYTNSAFAGIYSFSTKDEFSSLMRSWLHKLPDNSLIMCHPMLLMPDISNIAHSVARINEYQYLNSEMIIKDCDSANVRLDILKKPINYDILK